MRKVVWNEEIAEIAQRLVDQCKFAHDKKRNMCDGTYVGQNIFMAMASKQTEEDVMSSVDQAVINWYSEVEKPFDSSLINPFQYDLNNTSSFSDSLSNPGTQEALVTIPK